MQEITIKNYLRKVELSKARKSKYYVLGENHPKSKKYSDVSKYDWKDFAGKKYLVDLSTGDKVVANPIASGTPNVFTINGQAIYNGQIKEHTRAKIMREIKDSMMPFVNQMKQVIKFPVRIEAELHDTIHENKNLWDMDNRSGPYIKAFQDCLTGNKDKDGKPRCKVIIPDDNILFLSQPAAPRFIPIRDGDDRKIVFRIVEEDDDRIVGNVEYMSQLEKELKKY